MSEIMKELTIIDRVKIFERDGKQWTTSLNIAEVFGKKHGKIIRDIENLDCSQAFRQANFGLSSYVNLQNKTQKMYDISRDGFVFLVMGYIGKPAAQFKEAYIEAFNRGTSQKQMISSDFAEAMISIADTNRAIKHMIERHDCKLISIEKGQDKTDKRVEDIAIKQDIMADDLTYMKSKIDHVLKGGKFSAPVTAQHEEMILRRFMGNCPCCGDVQIIGKNGKLIDGVAEKEHFIGPTHNKIDQTWLTCKQCNRDKATGKLSMDFINKKFQSYQADLMMDCQRNKRIAAERIKTNSNLKQFGIFDFMPNCNQFNV